MEKIYTTSTLGRLEAWRIDKHGDRIKSWEKHDFVHEIDAVKDRKFERGRPESFWCKIRYKYPAIDNNQDDTLINPPISTGWQMHSG